VRVDKIGHRETDARTRAKAPAQPWTRLVVAAREAQGNKACGFNRGATIQVA